MSSMRRHGVAEDDLVKLHAAIDDVRLEGFAIHLPLDRTDGSDAVEEVFGWMERLRAARLPLHTMFVSHLKATEQAALQQQFPQTRFRAADRHPAVARRPRRDRVPRRGPRRAPGSPRASGTATGRRRRRGNGHLVVVAGGTSHGVGLEAPKALHGLMPRAKGVARAGLATVNRNLSPFVWAGKQRWFAEPPHMQVSILFLPGDVAPPAVGDELVAHLRHTTTQFDRDRGPPGAVAAVHATPCPVAARAAGGLRRRGVAGGSCGLGAEDEDVVGPVQHAARRVVGAVLPEHVVLRQQDVADHDRAQVQHAQQVHGDRQVVAVRGQPVVLGAAST